MLAEAEVRARKPTPSTAASAADLEAGVNEYLILFSGDRKLATRMAAQLRSIDPSAIVHERDVVNDAVAEDLLRSEVQEEIISGLYSSRYKAVYVAVPCSSYSIVRGDQIRSKAEPRGMRAAMARWGAYLAKHNQLADFAAFVLEICVELGVPWMVENPADRSLDGPAQWREFADWGCLWDQPRFRALILDGAKLHLVPMCACGSTFQKYVHVLVSPLLEERASALFGGLRCVHPSGHADQAVGVDARGQSKAAQTATYPVGFNVLAARIMAGDSPAAPRKAGTPLTAKQVAASSSGQLHVGSNRPHAADGASQQYQRADRAAPSGSLRCLEPELTSVLLNERLPEANVIRVTDPVDPPSIPLPAPGPFTTAQLIPAGVVRQVSEYGKLCGRVLRRASQGKDGWRVARQMRPEPVIFEEGEALMPVGIGYAWRRREPHLPLAPDSLWDAILPSTESHPPQVGAEHILDSAAFEQLAEAHGLTDNQLRSWVKHGFPGVGLPNVAVLAPPHVGALKEAAAFEERNSRDMGHGFCSACTPFPTIWPLVCDPCNVVVQNGKARLTIDKTMWISGKVHIPPYNLLVDLNAQAEKSGRLVLVRVAQVARAAAILLSPLDIFRHLTQPGRITKLKQKKWDLFAFFRMHAKQSLHVRESGRIMRAGFNHDWRCNFGERDAPDHTCRESDSAAYIIKCELLRLEFEYPTRIPELLAFLAHRRGLRGGSESAVDVLMDVLFWLCFYVDDGTLQTYDDALFDRRGNPVMISVTSNTGVISTHHQTRFDLYADTAIKICLAIGHGCPIDKQDDGDLIVYLGIQVDLVVQRRTLPRIKAVGYASLADECRKGRRTMPNGLAAASFALFNSLVHRLLHAADVIPLGRQHLFYCRQAIKQAKEVVIGRGRALMAVIVTSGVDKELVWWSHQLLHAGDTGLPLASRFSFPGASSECNLIRYSDASRELEQPIIKSGGGAWAVLRGTFYYVVIKWTKEELEQYSINVLEAHAANIGGRVFLDKAIELGMVITHTTAYIDNSTAECIAENGRASTAMLNALNLSRLEHLLARGVYETSERVTSIDNDVADLLSRDEVEEALRFPKDCDIPCIECTVCIPIFGLCQEESTKPVGSASTCKVWAPMRLRG